MPTRDARSRVSGYAGRRPLGLGVAGCSTSVRRFGAPGTPVRASTRHSTRRNTNGAAPALLDWPLPRSLTELSCLRFPGGGAIGCRRRRAAASLPVRAKSDMEFCTPSRWPGRKAEDQPADDAGEVLLGREGTRLAAAASIHCGARSGSPQRRRQAMGHVPNGPRISPSSPDTSRSGHPRTCPAAAGAYA